MAIQLVRDVDFFGADLRRERPAVTGEASLDWAERQRALRSLPESHLSQVASEGVRYSVFRWNGSRASSWLRLLRLDLLYDLARGIDIDGTYVALYRRDAAAGTAPSLVFQTADDATAAFPRRGEAVAFGQVEPGGALGLRIDGRLLWPTYLPRACRPYDPVW